MHEQLRHRVLGGWSDFVCRRPWWVLFVALATAMASIATTVARLEFQSDRNALLSLDLDWNRNFENWRSNFPGNDDFYVVVDAGPVDASGNAAYLAKAQAMVDELGPVLQADPHVELAVWGFDSDGFSPRSLRLLPIDEFEHQLARIVESKLVLTSPSLPRMLASVVGVMQQESGQVQEGQMARSIQSLTHLIRSVGRAMQTDSAQRSSFGLMVQAADAHQPKRNYLISDTGRLLFIRVTPRKEAGTINALRAAIAAIRGQIDHVLARYPQIDAGLTGIDVVEADETDAATRDSAIASLVAGVLITLMLIGAFHSWRVPLIAMASLLVGIAWSFGFLTLVVGHLQVLSVVFVVILLGLGVAFGIHVASRVELVRHRFPDDAEGFVSAMRDSYQTIGPGVVTGAVTTAAAFCTTMLTNFRGVAEMGLIASAGIMLCLLAMFSVFPALLCLMAPRWRHYVPIQDRRFDLFEPRWVMPFVRYPRITLIAALLLAGVSLLAVKQMTFDYDLLKLQPRGVASVQWQERITRDGGQSIWAAVSVVDSLDAARQRAAEFRHLESVSEVRGIGLLFPADEDRKLKRIGQIWQELEGDVAAALADGSVEGHEPTAQELTDPSRLGQAEPDLMAVLSGMRLGLQVAAARQMPATIRSQLDLLAEAIDKAMAVHAGLVPPQRLERLQQLHLEYRQWRRGVAQQVVRALDRSPLVPADLPAELLWPYIAKNGKGGVALEIHPKLPKDEHITGPLDPRFLPAFVGQLEKIDPNVTGVIVQVFRSGHMILHSYQMAGVYALVVVFLFVWIDFWSFRAGVLCLVPVAVGFAVTFGVMWLVNVSVNPANIIVLPLMFGIGVDSGVHLLHRYRQDPQTRPLGLGGGTGKGITVTSMTTMIGFGAMMFARHRGIASLGFVMMTGIGMTMLACWTVVPAWLQWRDRRSVGNSGMKGDAKACLNRFPGD